MDKTTAVAVPHTLGLTELTVRSEETVSCVVRIVSRVFGENVVRLGCDHPDLLLLAADTEPQPLENQAIVIPAKTHPAGTYPGGTYLAVDLQAAKGISAPTYAQIFACQSEVECTLDNADAVAILELLPPEGEERVRSRASAPIVSVTPSETNVQGGVQDFDLTVRVQSLITFSAGGQTSQTSSIFVTQQQVDNGEKYDCEVDTSARKLLVSPAPDGQWPVRLRFAGRQNALLQFSTISPASTGISSPVIAKIWARAVGDSLQVSATLTIH